MTVATPPTSTRFWFWASGRRVDPLYRPWAAQQIVKGDYIRRRLWSVIASHVIFIALPQTFLALSTHRSWQLITPALVLTVDTVGAAVVIVWRRPMNERATRRVLAYHGVTAEGALITPITAWSAWSAWPADALGKAGVAVLAGQVLVFSSGIAVAADQIAAHRACHALRSADAATLRELIGRPVPPAAAGLGAPTPVVAPGTRLVAAREVPSGLPGTRYVAGYITLPSGTLYGPGVWRVSEPLSVLNPGPTTIVDAQNLSARQITPDSAYGSSPGNPAVEQALNCARSAR